MVDPLELLFDAQFTRLEVHLIPVLTITKSADRQHPDQAKDFSPAQTEDEDQDEGGVQGFSLVPGRFKEPAGIMNGPGLPFTAGLAVRRLT